MARGIISAWNAIALDDSFGCGTFPRSISFSFATASSSLLTVGGVPLTIAATKALAGGTRYILV
jgi:hypothetical protein